MASPFPGHGGLVPANVGVFQLPPAPLNPPPMELLHSYTDWRRDWTHIVAGKFTDSPYSALLFYEQSTGVAEFYSTDGRGGISLLKHHEGWRQSWTHIVAGFFGQSSREGILLYDQSAGSGAFYDIDKHGGIVLLREQPEWRTTWTQIIAGKFTKSPRSSLLFYDQNAGFAQFYATDGHGGIQKLAEYSDWRTSWTRILAGEFVNHADWSEPRIDDLFFYEGSTGYGETYESDGHGGISLFGGQADMPSATYICPGSFGGTGPTDLAFYDATTGAASILDPQEIPGPDPAIPPGKWVTLDSYNWGPNWDLIVAGNFWMSDPDDHFFDDGGFTDFLFYSGNQGRGDFYLYEPPEPTPIEPFAGYVSSRSNLPGDTIGFHVSSQVGAYTIGIYRLGRHETYIGSVQNLAPPSAYPISRTAYKHGAQWPEVGCFELPANCASGLYVGRVQAPWIFPGEIANPNPPTAYARLAARPPRLGGFSGPSLDIPFVVRPRPQHKWRILFAIADNTYEAYSFFGGRSVYGFGRRHAHTWVYPSSSQYRAPYGFRVSFLRGTAPNFDGYGKKWQKWELPFLKWLDRQAIKVDVCTESDLHLHGDILSGYRLLVIVGHSEYWSLLMREQVERFVKNGGNLAIFSGNTCWWQVRFEDDGDTMVCYKQKDFDPVSNEKQKTVNWKVPYLQRPETRLTGVRYAGNPAPDAGFEFTVEDANHWVFANTGLVVGDKFGRYSPAMTVVGNETDAQASDSPSNFHRLGYVSDQGNEIATMGLFSPINGFDEMRGIVFNAATIDWTLGLSQDDRWNAMDIITRNVLIRLG